MDTKLAAANAQTQVMDPANSAIVSPRMPTTSLSACPTIHPVCHRRTTSVISPSPLGASTGLRSHQTIPGRHRVK